jgi:hypothetical protein
MPNHIRLLGGILLGQFFSGEPRLLTCRYHPDDVGVLDAAVISVESESQSLLVPLLGSIAF